MPPKRNRVVDAEVEEVVPTKVWKANPPGAEQKELDRLFQKGLVSSTDTPTKIRSRYQLFAAFPPKTFALHFRQTKAKLGLNAVSKNTSERIPELDGIVEEAKATSRSPIQFIESQLETRNYPYMSWTYTDHESQKDMCCVAVPMVTGSRDINFEISDDGLQLNINFVWPSPLLNPNDLFLM